LTGLRETQIVGKMLFLGITVTVFLEEVTMCISKLNKFSRLNKDLLLSV
jgi:hypothetical protein